MMYHRLAASTVTRSRAVIRQHATSNKLLFHSVAKPSSSSSKKNTASLLTAAAASVQTKRNNGILLQLRRASSTNNTTKTSSWWTNPELWGVITAVSGWSMSIAAMYDSLQDGPEVISVNMTGVLIVYSSLFLRWALVVRPRNLLLASCHFANVCAQTNQLRRAITYKMEHGQEQEVINMAERAAAVGGTIALAVAGGPRIQTKLVQANIPKVSELAASPAGPFYIHFWAPMSKWLISGASLLDWNRPTEKISLPQYAALTSCGILHARYALLVIPTNYMLCSVNLALFFSSAWHLGRKLKADYMDSKQVEAMLVEEEEQEEEVEPAVGRPATLIKRRTTWVLDGIAKADAKE